MLPWDNSLALAKAGFRDAWRAVFPDEVTHPGFTWPATAFGKKTTSWAPLSDERDRIDFIYASPEFHPSHAWIVGPRTCFIGGEKVGDPGADNFLAPTCRGHPTTRAFWSSWLTRERRAMHGTCFRRRFSTHHAGAAPHSAVAELGVVSQPVEKPPKRASDASAP